MPRTALLGLTLLLSGCSGYGHFLGDIFSFTTNRNAPIGDSENLRRARGQTVDIAPLQTEPGNVWPGPPPPLPTLSDIQQQQNAPPPAQPVAPDHRQPRPGSSTPPGSNAPGLAPAPAPGRPPRAPAPPPPGGAPQVFQTPGGPAQGAPAQGGGYQTLTNPQGGAGGIVIPNGNGTSTVIGPDGSVTTVPTPR